MGLLATQPQVSKLAIIIQQGKVLDFIDGRTQRNETPEEYVRQEIAKSLVREYRYAKADVEVEFVVRVGSRKPRADLVLFPAGTEHKQENALIIVECKSAKIKAEDKKDGVGQLQSYMAACPRLLTECGLTGSSDSATAELSKVARSHSKTFLIFLSVVRKRKTRIGRGLISSSLLRLTRCYSDFVAATITLQAIRAYRSRRPSGNC